MDDLSRRVQAFLDAYAGDAPVPESVVEIVGELENERRRLSDLCDRARRLLGVCTFDAPEDIADMDLIFASSHSAEGSQS